MTPQSPKTDPSAGAAHLGMLEAQVMDLLWQHSPRSIREVMDALQKRPAYTTVATVMQNLQRKELVRSQREGRAVFYLPTISREAYTAQMMRQALESSTDRTASILHFVQQMPAEELTMLREYLQDHSDQEPPTP